MLSFLCVALLAFSTALDMDQIHASIDDLIDSSADRKSQGFDFQEWKQVQEEDLSRIVHESLEESKASFIEENSALEGNKLDFFKALFNCNACKMVDGSEPDENEPPANMEIARVFALEWAVFPEPDPFPNPMMTYSCEPTPDFMDALKKLKGNKDTKATAPAQEMEPADLKEEVAKEDAADKAAKKPSKLGAMLRKIWDVMKRKLRKLGEGFMAALSMVMSIALTAMRCVICLICDFMTALWKAIKYILKKLGAGSLIPKIENGAKAAQKAVGRAMATIGHGLSAAASQVQKFGASITSRFSRKKDKGFLQLSGKQRRLHAMKPRTNTTLIQKQERLHAIHAHLLKSGAHDDPLKYAQEKMLTHKMMHKAIHSTLSFFQMSAKATTEDEETRAALHSKGLVSIPNACVNDDSLGNLIGIALNLENPKLLRFLMSGGVAVNEIIPEVLIAVVPFPLERHQVDPKCLYYSAKDGKKPKLTKAEKEADESGTIDKAVDEEMDQLEKPASPADEVHI